MTMIGFSSMARSPLTASMGVALLLYACSFKNFDYLQEGAASGGASGSGGGQSETGGSDATGGTTNGGRGGTGGAKPTGGNGGASGGSMASGGDAGNAGRGEAGSAGEGGNAGAGGEGAVGGEGIGGGGAGGGGGTSTGGTGTGGTGTGGTGTGGGSSVLVNPSFELGLNGWTVDPPSAIQSKYIYTQYPQSGTPPDGAYELATWHMYDAYTVEISQHLTGLADGTYTLKGMFSSQKTQQAFLFAHDCGGTDVTVNIPPQSFQYFPISLTGIVVSGGSCVVGLHIQNIALDWMNADMFTFEKDP